MEDSDRRLKVVKKVDVYSIGSVLRRQCNVNVM